MVTRLSKIAEFIKQEHQKGLQALVIYWCLILHTGKGKELELLYHWTQKYIQQILLSEVLLELLDTEERFIPLFISQSKPRHNGFISFALCSVHFSH